MSVLDLARLQFASTSIYHFLFVPLTIGLSLITAMLQTRWYRTGWHLRRGSSTLGFAGSARLALTVLVPATTAAVSADGDGPRGHV